MISADVWKKFRTTGIIETDEQLLGMMQDLVDLRALIDNAYGGSYIVTGTITNDYYHLEVVAQARNIPHAQRPQFR